MPLPRCLAVALLVLTLSLLGRPLPVAAHAYLERAEPAPDAVLPSAPARLRLWFTETLEPSFSEVIVVDAARQPVHTTRAQVSADGLAMTLELPPLPDGTYTVTWKTLSTVDGHPARGFYALTIGAAPAPAPAAVPAALPLPADEVPLPVKATVRWLTFTGQALLAGGLLVGLLVLAPALAAAGVAAGAPAGRLAWRWQRRLVWAALIATALAALAALPIQAASAAGLPLAQALGPPLLAVLATRYGLIWAVRALLLALLAGLLLAVGRPWRLARPASWLAAGLGLGLLLTTSLTSHAAALREGALPAVLADWLHLVATSLWLGGLALLVAVAPAAAGAAPPEARPRLLSALVGRFSALALGAVALLIATGAGGAVLYLRRLDALWTTDYGRALLAKLLLLLPMLALGAFNLLGVRPVLARAAAVTRTLSRRRSDLAAAAARAWRRLGYAVRAELALGLLILAATGVLTSLAPPPAVPVGSLRLTEMAADLRLTLAITPAQPGDNTLTLTVTRDGRPAEGVSKALVRLTYLDQDLGETEIVLTPAGDGWYVAQGRQLSVIGRWQAELIVRRDGQDDARSAVRFTIPASAPANMTPTLTPAGTVALVMLVLAAGLMLVAIRLRWAGSLAGGLFGAGAGAAALAVYLLVTSGLTAVPGADTRGPRNPFPPTAQSLAQGRTLYIANCQTCHGAGGRGDGPSAASLNPPPLDLTQHVAFHPDAELYHMISQGVRGTAMPAFAGRLTEEERWHLVNYIRTFDATGAGVR